MVEGQHYSLIMYVSTTNPNFKIWPFFGTPCNSSSCVVYLNDKNTLDYNRTPNVTQIDNISGWNKLEWDFIYSVSNIDNVLNLCIDNGNIKEEIGISPIILIKK